VEEQRPAHWWAAALEIKILKPFAPAHFQAENLTAVLFKTF